MVPGDAARPRDPVWAELARIWQVREREAVGAKQALTPRLLDDLPQVDSPALVIGGGAGLIPVHLARAGHDVTAIDGCAAMIELSRARADREGVSVRLVHARAASAAVETRFATVIASTGVLTPETLHTAETAALLERLPGWVAPDGTLLLAMCLETDQNQEYRALYRELGLNRVVSNNRLLLGTDSLVEIERRFSADPDLDPAAVLKWFGKGRGLLSAQHRMIRAFEAELNRQSVAPGRFVAAYLGYEKPFLTAAEERFVIDWAAARYARVERRLLRDDETAVVIARGAIEPDPRP